MVLLGDIAQPVVATPQPPTCKCISVALQWSGGEYAHSDTRRPDIALQRLRVRQILRGQSVRRKAPSGFPRRSDGNRNRGIPIRSRPVQLRLPRDRGHRNGWHRKRSGLDGRPALRLGHGTGRGRDQRFVSGDRAMALCGNPERNPYLHRAISRRWNRASLRRFADPRLAGSAAAAQLRNRSQRH